MIWALVLRFWKPLAVVAAVLCVALCVRGYGNRRDAAGYVRARAEDDKALAAFKQREIVLNAAAHARYEEQHAQILIAARQPVGVSELCKPAPSPVRHKRPAPAITPAEVSATRVVGKMPETDNGQPYDRARLLGDFAALGAEASAVIAEFQGRSTTQRHDIPP